MRGNARLSVVVVIAEPPDGRSDLSGLAATLEAVAQQTIGPPFEVIVPCAATPDLAPLKDRFPDTRFLEFQPEAPAGSPERAEELRAFGVDAARGEVIALLEDHVRPDPQWSAAILSAHLQPFAAIGGAIENGVDRIWNWAIYFSDIGRYHNPLRQGESQFASVVNVSYDRSALQKVRTVWQRRFNETAVHGALMAVGEKLALSPKIVVRQYWPRQTVRAVLRQFFDWGRSYGQTRTKLMSPGRRLLRAILAPLIPFALLLRSARDTARKRRLIRQWLKALPASALLTVAWSCGEFAGYITPRHGDRG